MLFSEGMGLVEEAANYLDGEGRLESKLLDRSTSILYASESMRLTTRLMQVASWLLLQRAVSDGEMSQNEAFEEKTKVSLDTLMPSDEDPGFAGLPIGLRALIDKSIKLQARVKRWDQLLNREDIAEGTGENAVREQVNRLAEAFGNMK